MRSVQQMEVDWYRENGRYPSERIVRDANGQEYVIGDWSWHRMNKPFEEIEPAMRFRLPVNGTSAPGVGDGK